MKRHEHFNRLDNEHPSFSRYSANVDRKKAAKKISTNDLSRLSHVSPEREREREREGGGGGGGKGLTVPLEKERKQKNRRSGSTSSDYIVRSLALSSGDDMDCDVD